MDNLQADVEIKEENVVDPDQVIPLLYADDAKVKVEPVLIHKVNIKHEIDATVFEQELPQSSHECSNTGEQQFECNKKGVFECGTCGLEFNLKGNYNLHMRIHTSEKPFKCKICDKKYITNSTLRRHMKTHSGEKRFECKICGEKYARHDTLQRHIRTHTGEKPFECKICGKKFSQTGHLPRHMKIHTE